MKTLATETQNHRERQKIDWVFLCLTLVFSVPSVANAFDSVTKFFQSTGKYKHLATDGHRKNTERFCEIL